MFMFSIYANSEQWVMNSARKNSLNAFPNRMRPQIIQSFGLLPTENFGEKQRKRKKNNFLQPHKKKMESKKTTWYVLPNQFQPNMVRISCVERQCDTVYHKRMKMIIVVICFASFRFQVIKIQKKNPILLKIQRKIRQQTTMLHYAFVY